MTILRTRPDPTRPPRNDGFPPTFANTEAHWRDGSQLHDSDKDFQNFVCSGTDGELNIGPDGLIVLHPNAPVQPSNVAGWACRPGTRPRTWPAPPAPPQLAQRGGSQGDIPGDVLRVGHGGGERPGKSA